MHPIAPLAREAYAAGWASTSAPMTDRVRAGSIAAVALAVERCDDPHVLEATLQLGQLEGMWATVFDRRERLHRRTERQALAAWHRAIADIDTAAVLDQYQQVVADNPPPGDTIPEQRQHYIDLALPLLIAALGTVAGTMAWKQLGESLAADATLARAEGRAAATAVLDAERDHPTSWAATLAAHLHDLADRETEDASTALGDAVTGTARDLARLLARSVLDGITRSVLSVDFRSMLGGARGLLAALDQFISRIYGAGMADVYTAADAEALIAWITAADGKVCAACEDLEDSGPYAPVDVPDAPHPGCRCTTAPADSSTIPGGTS
jgi:hypothetical protein